MAKLTREEQADKKRKRIRSATDPDSYTYTPPKDNNEYAKTNEFQRVAIYARVSTLNPMQTSSFELQQKYYIDLVKRYPKWTLVKIYTDEGKSGVTTEHRDGFNEMMRDAMAQKFDLIIVKSISRLARNVITLLTTVRKLAEKKIGVLFESEAVFSLNDTNQLALTFQATVAEEESRIRSRSMEASLRMRLDHGLPLTPELLGFMKNEDGKLIVNPDTKDIPKLMFYMYLYGYSTQQIADTLTKLCKRTYLGNLKWSSSGISASLRNERYCGDVRTRKRFKKFAADVVGQKTFKNRGEKPQSYYIDEHDSIVSHDDFIAVQRIMQNAKYGGTSLLPELKVIPDGLLKGFVIVHPKWGSFTKEDYIKACESVDQESTQGELIIEVPQGSFDMRKFHSVGISMFQENRVPAVLLQKRDIQFNKACMNGMGCGNYVELLVHPLQKKIAIRPTTKENKYAIKWTNGTNTTMRPRHIACAAYIDTLFQMFGWDPEYRVKMYGPIYRDGKNTACIFTSMDANVFIKKEQLISSGLNISGTFLNQSGKRVRAYSGEADKFFGQNYYVEKTMKEMLLQTREQWQTRIEGQLCATSGKLNVTPYEELRAFIQQELGDLFEEIHTV